jgi:hypothetical protein
VEAHLRLHLVADLLHLRHFDRTGAVSRGAGSEREGGDRRQNPRGGPARRSRGNRG